MVVRSAAEAAGISDRTARMWLARYRAEGPGAGWLDRCSAPVIVANRSDERRVEVIAALRRLRMTGAEIAEELGYGAVDRDGDPDADRDGQARPSSAWSPWCAMSEFPGELIRIDRQEAGPRRRGCRQVLALRAAPALPADAQPTPPGSAAGASSAGNAFMSRSTTRPAWPTRSPRREKADTAIRHIHAAPIQHFSSTASAPSDSSPTTARPTAPRCTRSPVAPSGSAISAPGDPSRTADHVKAERFDPHPPGRLGLRRDLPLKRRTHRRARRLDRLLQSPPTTAPVSHKPPIARPQRLNNLLGSYI